MQNRLRRIRDDAGGIRDLDVFKERWTTSIQADLVSADWLMERVDVELSLRTSRMLKWTRNTVCRRFHERTEEIIARVHWRGDGKAPAAHSWSLRTLAKMAEELDQQLATSGTDTIHCHRARIQGRRVRYALEVCGTLLSAARVSEACSELSDLQNSAGHINDDTTAIRMLEQAVAECSEPGLQASLQKLLAETRSVAADRFAAWVATAPERRRRLARLLQSILDS